MATKRAAHRSAPEKSPAGTSIVSDPLEIRRLLARACEGRASATLKVRGRDEVLRAQVIETDATREGVHLQFAEDPGMLNSKTFEDLSTAARNRDCMLLLYLQGRSIVGINAEPSELRKDRMVFSPPQKLFKIQRRKDVRFVIPAGYEFTVEMESLEQPRARVRKKLIDLSESGLSFFLLSPREAALFRPGLILPRCLIEFQGNQISAILKVRNHAKHDRGAQGAGNKIGAEFEQISPADQKFIAEFVYSQAQHLFY